MKSKMKPQAKPPIEKVGRVSNASVLKGSGRGWDEWIRLLTKAGAQDWTHQKIVAHLTTKYKLTPWWQQGVTLGFEIHTGRRIEGQTQKGDYTLTVTKSTKADPKKVWKFMTSDEGLALWLRPLSPLEIKKDATYESESGAYGKIRTLLKGVRIRMSWQDAEDLKPTIAQLYIAKQKNGSTIIVISHDSVKTLRQKEDLRRFWREGLEQVAEALKTY